MSAVMPWSSALLLLVAALPAQRPRTAEEALDRYAKVREQGEAERRRAVGDLGDFDGEAVTAALLGELARTADPGFLQTVVRAIGKRARPGVVPPLRAAFDRVSNSRLLDSIGEALARQGDPGVQALGELLAAEPTGSARRTAACEGLGKASGNQARDLLLQECKASGGRDRLPALRALQHRLGDAEVDAARELLAGDRDPLVAATALRQLATGQHSRAPELARQLAARLGPEASAEHFTAVLHGLLVAPEAVPPEALLVAATRAEAPFGEPLLPGWGKALAVPTVARWFVEATTTRKTAAEQAMAAKALAFAPAAEQAAAAAALTRALTAKEPEVVRAAADTLAAFGPQLGRPPLDKLLATATEATAPLALNALHELRRAEPTWAAELLRLAIGKLASGRAAALHLLARLPAVADAEVVAAAAANLDHKAWPVRSAAIDLLVARRAAAGVPLLIERLAAEHGRVGHDLTEALFELTRLRFPDVAAWRSWWAKEGPTFQVPAPRRGEREDRGRNAATVASYWNIPVTSDRVVFVVDVSGSMNQPFGTGGGTRLDEAKRQLQRVLGLLPAKAKANVIVFGNDTQAMADGLQPLDERRKKAAETWTQALQSRGATNVHAGLWRAFQDPEVDTIFLLTDGQPSTGEIVAPTALANAVQAWNTGRGIRIHTVAIGGKSDFLERLATDSGGEHSVAR